MLFWSSQFKLDCRDNVNLIIISRGHFLKWIFWRCLKCFKRPLPSTTPSLEQNTPTSPNHSQQTFISMFTKFHILPKAPHPNHLPPHLTFPKKNKKNYLHPLVKDTPYNAMNNDEKLTIYLLSMHLSMFP